MATIRTQVEDLYRRKVVSNKIVLDQALLAGVDVDDEAASQVWRDRMVAECRHAMSKAETRAELNEIIQAQVGWLRYIEPSCLGDLKQVATMRMSEIA